VLWTRIWIIILPDPGRDRHPGHADPDPANPDRYQVQANENVEKLNFFPENFNIVSKIMKISKLTML
jgi:hypothetical protein